MNFGFNVELWDRLHGTLRQKDKIYRCCHNDDDDYGSDDDNILKDYTATDVHMALKHQTTILMIWFSDDDDDNDDNI